MTLYVDENLPRTIVEGFNILHEPQAFKTGHHLVLKYIPDEFGSGCKDPKWLPKLDPEACVLTVDRHIQKNASERELYQVNEVGMFFLRGKSYKQSMLYWEMVAGLANHWPAICRIACTEQRPFAYQVPITGSRLKRI